MVSPVEWDVEPGDLVRRTELHDRFGGGRQGGIAPSRQAPVVMIFSDAGTGAQHGYFDRWDGNSFHYAGEGQRGDQVLNKGNAAILNHRRDGRSLRVFWGSKGVVDYAGEFELDDDDPYHWVDAPATGGGPLRRVVMFHLRPLGTAVATDLNRPARRTVKPELVTPYRPIDPNRKAAPRDPFEIDPDIVDRGLRGHAQTQELLAALVRVHGLKPLSPGPGDPNFDLAWKDGGSVTVVEVKSLTNANEVGQVRLGLGQVLDYQYSLMRPGDEVRAVLALEAQPTQHARWNALCAAHGVVLTWPDRFELLFS